MKIVWNISIRFQLIFLWFGKVIIQTKSNQIKYAMAKLPVCFEHHHKFCIKEKPLFWQQSNSNTHTHNFDNTITQLYICLIVVWRSSFAEQTKCAVWIVLIQMRYCLFSFVFILQNYILLVSSIWIHAHTRAWCIQYRIRKVNCDNKAIPSVSVMAIFVTTATV